MDTGLMPRRDKEVDLDAIHLRQSLLEIISRDEHPLLPRELDQPRNEHVLRQSADERAPF